MFVIFILKLCDSFLRRVLHTVNKIYLITPITRSLSENWLKKNYAWGNMFNQSCMNQEVVCFITNNTTRKQTRPSFFFCNCDLQSRLHLILFHTLCVVINVLWWSLDELRVTHNGNLYLGTYAAVVVRTCGWGLWNCWYLSVVFAQVVDFPSLCLI